MKLEGKIEELLQTAVRFGRMHGQSCRTYDIDRATAGLFNAAVEYYESWGHRDHKDKVEVQP